MKFVASCFSSSFDCMKLSHPGLIAGMPPQWEILSDCNVWKRGYLLISNALCIIIILISDTLWTQVEMDGAVECFRLVGKRSLKLGIRRSDWRKRQRWANVFQGTVFSEDCFRACLDLEDLVGRKLEVLFLQHAFIHLAPSIHLFIALFFSFPLRDLDCATFEFLMKSSFDFAKCWQWYHPEKISSNSYSSSGRTGLKWWL